MKRKSSQGKTEYAFRFLVVMAITLSFGSSALTAQDGESATETPKKKPGVEMLECRVKVVDPDGHPVEDAVVYYINLRSNDEPGTYLWSDEIWGKAPKIKTDADGIATMPYPKMLADGVTTGKLTYCVDHPDFVSYNADFSRANHSVDDDPSMIVLERGFRIAITAVDDAGKKITQRLHAVVSFENGGIWEIKKNGTLVSNVMKKQDGILRVACFQKDKPTLFSEEIEIKPGDKSRLLLQDIKLSLGCRVQGRIDESVTRPIKNGYVIASIYKLPDPENWASLWLWRDEAKITEEGTFVFESLPANEVVQMIPVCDGWVPGKPKVKDVLELLPTAVPHRVKSQIQSSGASPQLVKTGRIKTEANLSMVQAETVTLKVVDQNGNPLQGIKMTSFPQQVWFTGGSVSYTHLTLPTKRIV